MICTHYNQKNKLINIQPSECLQQLKSIDDSNMKTKPLKNAVSNTAVVGMDNY